MVRRILIQPGSNLLLLFHLLVNLVEYQHSKTLVTPLMVAAVSDFSIAVEKLIQLGACLQTKSCNQFTALDWAKRFSKNEIVELLECYMYKFILFVFSY